MNRLPREGLRELRRLARRLWLRAATMGLERKLAEAEIELGWLGWEQVDFFDAEINAEVDKIRDFERRQASLLNLSAEKADHLVEMQGRVAQAAAVREEALLKVAAQRAPIEAQLAEMEKRQRERAAAVERFDRAAAELTQREVELQARHREMLMIERHTSETRGALMQVGDELLRLPEERRLVMADKARVGMEARQTEEEMATLREELRRLDGIAAQERARCAAVERELMPEIRQLERERKKSAAAVTRWDKEKRKPFRAIGACLADFQIAPLNQPEAFERVMALRGRKAVWQEELAGLVQASAEADWEAIRNFYLIAGAIVLVIVVLLVLLLAAR